MILAAFERFGKWWNDKAWPTLRDKAWPAVTGAYAAHEGARQFVTFIVGVIVGWAVS